MKRFGTLAAFFALIGCATLPPIPEWNAITESAEREYDAYISEGSAHLSGQAFLAQSGGGVVKSAGRTVTLDPATNVGNEWWGKAGKTWVHQDQVPPSPGFLKARRTTIADAEGRFRFANIPAGKYYVRTQVTWEIGGYMPTQGGLVGAIVDVRAGETIEVILNKHPK